MCQFFPEANDAKMGSELNRTINHVQNPWLGGRLLACFSVDSDLLSVWSPSISRTFLQTLSDQPLVPRDHCHRVLLLAVG